MSNNYCLKASGKQIVELARLMDVHSRRTGFDEPILYLGDACRLEPYQPRAASLCRTAL